MSKEKTIADFPKKKSGIVMENRSIEKFPIDATGELTAGNFIDILLMCLNNPDPKIGFTPKTMVEASNLYRKLESARGDSEFQITNAELTKLKESFNRMAWGKIVPGVVDLAEYMETF